MTVYVPKFLEDCAFGHRMLFRTVLLPEHEKIVIIGCSDPTCPESVNLRIKEMAEDYWLEWTSPP